MKLNFKIPIVKQGLQIWLLYSLSTGVLFAIESDQLKVITSADPGSNEARSFVYVENGLSIPQGIKKSAAASVLTIQIPFVIDLPVMLSADDTVRWSIKTSSKDIGKVNILSKHHFKQKNNQQGYLWESGFLTTKDIDRQRLVFRPKPGKHQPAIYKKGRGGNGKRQKYGGGTVRINHKPYNPRLSYQVQAEVRSASGLTKTYEAQIRMDNKDMVRQEYILHHGINRYGRGDYGNLPVPLRSELSSIPDMPAHLLGKALSESRYGLMIDDGLTELAVDIVRLYEAAKAEYRTTGKKILDLNNKVLPIPETELWLSGGWRNPERNEWFSNALNGIHQRGGAIDIVANEPHDDVRSARVYWFLWELLNDQNSLNAFWQLETNGRPMITREFNEDIDPVNGIPDAFDKADHIHINIKYE